MLCWPHIELRASCKFLRGLRDFLGRRRGFPKGVRQECARRKYRGLRLAGGEWAGEFVRGGKGRPHSGMKRRCNASEGGFIFNMYFLDAPGKLRVVKDAQCGVCFSMLCRPHIELRASCKFLRGLRDFLGRRRGFPKGVRQKCARRKYRGRTFAGGEWAGESARGWNGKFLKLSHRCNLTPPQFIIPRRRRSSVERLVRFFGICALQKKHFCAA